MDKTILINRLSKSFLSPAAAPIIFFIALLACLFVGDGRQTIVEVVGAGGVLILYLFVKHILRLNPRYSKDELIMFGFAFLYLTTRSFFSDDVGYSLYITARYVCAFLIYGIFRALGDNRIRRTVLLLTLFFCFGVQFLVVINILFPDVFLSMRSTNLITYTYGHSHAVDVLLFVLPLVAMRTTSTKSKRWLLCFLIIIAGIFLSLSRLAFIIMSIYLVYLMLFKPLLSNKTVTALNIIVIFIITLAAFVSGLIYTSNARLIGKMTPILIRKEAAFNDRRFEYWRQGLTAIKHKPFFGSGPGTFYLNSIKYQSYENTYSSYSHSYLLELWVETGLFTGTAFILFIVYKIISLIRAAAASSLSGKDWIDSVIHGLLIVFIYSFFEYNLNFIVVWFMFWAFLGIASPILKHDYAE